MSNKPAERAEQMGRMMFGLADLLELATLKLREFGAELLARRAKHNDPNQKR